MIDLSKVLLKFISETFKVAALKRIKPSVRKIFKEMQSLTELSKVLLEFVSETFSKYLLQSDGQFALWSFLYKPLHNQGNKTFKRISQSAIKFVSETLSR